MNTKMFYDPDDNSLENVVRRLKIATENVDPTMAFGATLAHAVVCGEQAGFTRQQMAKVMFSDQKQ